MRFRIIRNIIKQGFEGMWRNRGMGLASVSSITAVLLILGLVLILVLSINNVVADTQAKFDILQIYLDENISPVEINNIEDLLRKNDRVESYKFESDKEALDNMKEDWGEDGYLLDGLEEDNPLPSSFVVKLKGIEYTEEVVKELEKEAGVEGIPYYKDLIDKLLDIAKYIRLGGLFITGILVLVSIFIISNTIKLTVASRKREINIMKYVGATNSYIRGPFVIEGVLFGLVAALLSIVIINLGYDYLFQLLSDRIYYMLSVYLVPPAALFKDISIIFLAIGAGIGALGSMLSMRRYLNV